jgi:hypothetical protein
MSLEEITVAFLPLHFVLLLYIVFTSPEHLWISFGLFVTHLAAGIFISTLG